MPADPRVIDNEEQGILVLPFNIENASTTPSLDESDIGSPVALTANNEISEGADDEVFLGKLLGISDCSRRSNKYRFILGFSYKLGVIVFQILN